jgi:hypothetical protein
VSGRAWLLIAWIVVGAAALVVHAVVLWQVLRARDLAPKWRALAIIPVAAPVLAWMDKRRTAPILWAVLVGGYVILRLLA